jgi:hypothetical protein
MASEVNKRAPPYDFFGGKMSQGEETNSGGEDNAFLPCSEKLLTAIGATMADAVRVLRPGGPLDRTHYDMECPHCRSRTDKSLRWFYEHDVRCEQCGAQFNRSQIWAPFLATMVMRSNPSLAQAVKAGDFQFDELVGISQTALVIKGVDAQAGEAPNA